MDKKEEKTKNLDWQLLKRLLGFARPYKSLFLGTLLIAVLLAPVSMIRPKLIQIMVDDYILADNMGGLKFMAIIYFITVMANATLRYLFIYGSALLGQSVIKDMRTKIFDHITAFKLRYFDQTAIGTVTTRTINDIEAINRVFEQGIITIVADILAIFAVLGIMLYTSWRLTLICLLTLPLMIIASYIFKEKVKESFQRVRSQISKMNAFLQERITGMRVIQIFNAEKQEMDKFKKINRDYTQANVDSVLYYAIFFPVVELISALSLALMVWLGARSYVSDDVTFGALVAFPMYLNLLFRPVRMLADKFNQLQMGLVASDRVFKIFDTQANIPDNGKLSPESLRGDIQFDKVGFAYDDINYVLEDISFNIKAGDTLAIVGSTGSGKSTVINILNRFYEIQKGQITIDGNDIKEYKLDSLRQRVSVVLQDVLLFNGTIFENITLRAKDITLEQVMASAKMIGAHPFIEQMPGGYDFKVMERGNNLSVGQRQLISFVRALVKNPDILILDEATSSIDTETEAIIQYAIEKLIEKRTSIIIAHRLSTIKHASQILVLDKGKIKEYGTHEELLQIEDGRYRQLYDFQFAETV